MNQIKKEGANIFLLGHKCYRCGHEWLPMEKGRIPKVCPKCKSPYWDTPKKILKKGVKKNGKG